MNHNHKVTLIALGMLLALYAHAAGIGAAALGMGMPFALFWVIMWLLLPEKTWIRCDKQLPYVGQAVFYVHYGFVYRGHYSMEGDMPYFSDGYSSRLWYPQERVSHWTPSPTPTPPPIISIK